MRTHRKALGIKPTASLQISQFYFRILEFCLPKSSQWAPNKLDNQGNTTFSNMSNTIFNVLLVFQAGGFFLRYNTSLNFHVQS